MEDMESEEYPPAFADDLPGFGQPMDYVPTPRRMRVSDGSLRPEILPRNGTEENLFVNALCSDDTQELKCWEERTRLARPRNRCYGRLITLRELSMMRWMNTVTDKPDWDVKIFDETIVAKWKAETLSTADADFTDAMFYWCISELRWKTLVYYEAGATNFYEADVMKSDKAIPQPLREALSAAVEDLEGFSGLHKDWHPGTDEKVLDLVHPSLFPLVYGQTRILPHSLVGLDDCIEKCGEGERSPLYPHCDIDAKYSEVMSDLIIEYSKYFQWLPCNVDIGDGVKIQVTSITFTLKTNICTQLSRK